jgi:hypothetical protein
MQGKGGGNSTRIWNRFLCHTQMSPCEPKQRRVAQKFLQYAWKTGMLRGTQRTGDSL